MTPLDAETQRLLAIYDAWLACRCGEQERWAEDGAGRCKHERALHYVAEEACEHIRALSERLARVEGDAKRYREVRKWSPVVFTNAWQLNIRTGKPFDEIVDDLRPFTDAAAAIRAGE